MLVNLEQPIGILLQYGVPLLGPVLFTIGFLGGSGGVGNSLDFYPASLKSLGRFYFSVVRLFFKMGGGGSEFAKFKGILKARIQNVSGNKQQLIARAIGCPKPHFFYELTIFWSADKRRKDTFFPPSITFPL